MSKEEDIIFSFETCDIWTIKIQKKSAFKFEGKLLYGIRKQSLSQIFVNTFLIFINIMGWHAPSSSSCAKIPIEICRRSDLKQVCCEHWKCCDLLFTRKNVEVWFKY